MSLRQVVATPFQQGGTDRLPEQEFVVALSLHRDWFSPGQAKRAVERAIDAGLLEREDEELVATFDLQAVEVPTDFAPDESVLSQQPIFEVMLERLVDAGCDKRVAVSQINRIQNRYGVTIEAAAAIFGTSEGVELSDEITRARRELLGEDTS